MRRAAAQIGEHSSPLREVAMSRGSPSSVFAAKSIALRLRTQMHVSSMRVEITPEAHVLAFTPWFDIDVEPRQFVDCARAADQLRLGCVRLLVGDESQAQNPSGGVPANLLIVEIDAIEQIVQVQASIVGLPPLYTSASESTLCVSAPTACHPWLHEKPRSLDMRGVADLCVWGYPIENRTLYTGLALALSGSTLEFHCGKLSSHRQRLPAVREEEPKDLRALVEFQQQAFDTACRRMETSQAFLSLGGGLDSRAVLGGLCANARPIPCVTLAFSDNSLDLQNARAACALAGVPHRTVLLGDEYYRQLPELFLTAAQLTGGVSALAQTVDLFLYRCMGADYTRRISGNMGNQVGRGGVERLSSPNVDKSILSDDLCSSPAFRERVPWFIRRMHEQQDFATVLFQEEIPFASAANYALGSAFAVQVTPYADGRLMQAAATLHNKHFSREKPIAASKFRFRDLRHRASGPPRRVSFQRHYLTSRATQIQQAPLNWGWYSDGHMDISRAGVLVRAAASAASSRIVPSHYWDRFLRPVNLHPCTYWDMGVSDKRLRESLRECALDIAGSAASKETGVFNNARLLGVLERYFAGGPVNRDTIAFALEIGAATALTQKIASGAH